MPGDYGIARSSEHAADPALLNAAVGAQPTPHVALTQRAMRTLTQRELNRALLARQLLLERGRMPLPKALERIGGIQAQYAPSMYIGLWSRLEGFTRDALTRALERRSVDPGHADAPHHPPRLARRLLAAGARRPRGPPRALAARRCATPRRRRRWPARRAGCASAMNGTISRKEIEALLGRPRASGVGLWIDLVRVPPSGTWERRRADLYAAAEDWVGPPPDDGDAAEHLVRRYLAGFGPASEKDVVELHRAAAHRGPRDRSTGSSCAASTAGWWISPARRSPTPRRRRRRASCRPGTRRCSSTPAAPACCPRSTGRRSSASRRRTRSRPSWSTARWPVRGGTRRAGSSSKPFGRLDAADRRALKEEADRLAEFHS